MRQITVKYAGQCRKCGTDFSVGDSAIYEKHVGLFCVGCAPTDTEDIRAYRTEAAEGRAEKYDGWAEKRREKAAGLNAMNAPFKGDIAFFTQPGRFTARTRYCQRSEKMYEHSSAASHFEDKAASLRANVHVKGDADRKRQAQREAVLTWLKVGMTVNTYIIGIGKVTKINRKTASIDCGYGPRNIDLSFLVKID